ncbi:hypothetical protein [Actinomadura terrae]|uniref:hypothetical protein n=1 Tax=Actinomadura terrae TaxID=604353 RepID=UPI001FA6C849|nr:hypothetical protein [Actinomadura terrae]
MITVIAAAVSVAVLAYLAGMARGQRIERRRALARDEADMEETAAEFGPLAVGLISRPGSRTTLRRIK